MTTTKKRAPRVSPFAQMLRDKREKLAPDAPLRDFCASRGFDALMISDMEADRRTAPGTYAALYKLASGYGHEPTDRWTRQLLEAAVGKAPAPQKSVASARRETVAERSRGPAANRSGTGADAGSRSRG